nr:hypothetical protein [Tanacetum cinerariifolium]
MVPVSNTGITGNWEAMKLSQQMKRLSILKKLNRMMNKKSDSELKEEDLRNKAIMEGLINKDVESNDEDNVRYELCDYETHEFSVCNIRRFKMVKYSFEQEEEYVAV